MVKDKVSTLNLTPAQLKCLASPIRAEIVRTLSAEGQLSIKALATALGRSAGRLYHHIQVLHEAGLVRVAGTRRVGARTEASYALVAPRLSSADAVRSELGRGVFADVGRRFLASAARRFGQAALRPEVALEGPARTLSIRQIQIKASAEVLTELNKDLDLLIDKYSAAHDDGQPITISLVVTPGA